MSNGREYFVSEPDVDAKASVIWLHGLGADGSDFAGIVNQLGLPRNHGVRFIFPSAPFRNITINQGMLMRAWYDIYDLITLRKEDEPGIKTSQTLLGDMIANETKRGIAHKNILLAGFSQGGALALYTGLRHEQKLGGIVALSTYLPLAQNFVANAYPVNRETPIFMAHGIFDPVVPFNLGQAAHELLIANDYEVEWYSYPMVHTVCLEEIEVIGKFIKRCLGYA